MPHYVLTYTTTTTKSTQVLLAVLPHMRAALLSQLPQNRTVLLLELDRVSQEIVEHHGEILSKFVAIVADGMDSAVPKLRSVDWDSWESTQLPRGDAAAAAECEYFEALKRNIEALHRVLITDGMLPLEQAQDVFSRVFALLQRRLPKHFESIIAPSTKTGKRKILDEVGHLGNAFALLRQLDSSELVRSLETHFNERFGE